MNNSVVEKANTQKIKEDNDTLLKVAEESGKSVESSKKIEALSPIVSAPVTPSLEKSESRRSIPESPKSVLFHPSYEWELVPDGYDPSLWKDIEVNNTKPIKARIKESWMYVADLGDSYHEKEILVSRNQKLQEIVYVLASHAAVNTKSIVLVRDGIPIDLSLTVEQADLYNLPSSSLYIVPVQSETHLTNIQNNYLKAKEKGLNTVDTDKMKEIERKIAQTIDNIKNGTPKKSKVYIFCLHCIKK